MIRRLISGGTFEAFEQARIAAELAEQQIVEPVLRTGSCLDTQRHQSQFGELALLTTHALESSVHSLELKRSRKNRCHHTASLEVDPEPITAEERMAAERRREEHLQARFDQWPKLSIDDDIRLALRAILPQPEEANQDGSDVGCVAERESGSRHSGPRHSGPRHSSDGKRLSASVWRSRYNGCRRCGEETTKLSHWGQYDTERIYQGVSGLLALLTMVPWKEMTSVLEQLRAGRVDLGQWPMEIREALDATNYFCQIRYKAIYWYLIEMIAVRLKTGELRNPKIYEFNPDILYDPKRNKINKTRSNERTKTIPANGRPPPGKKHNQTAAP
jgi:hypothetical protein